MDSIKCYRLIDEYTKLKSKYYFEISHGKLFPNEETFEWIDNREVVITYGDNMDYIEIKIEDKFAEREI